MGMWEWRFSRMTLDFVCREVQTTTFSQNSEDGREAGTRRKQMSRRAAQIVSME